MRVKTIAKPTEQGCFFGLLDGDHGLVEALLATASLVLFAWIVDGRGVLYGDAFMHVLYIFSAVCVVLGFRLCSACRCVPPQGFTQSQRDLAFAASPVPNYTTLCRRAQALGVQLPITRYGDPIYLVVDSTGAKVCGEGEWKVRQHGYSKRRTWHKVHLGSTRAPVRYLRR